MEYLQYLNFAQPNYIFTLLANFLAQLTWKQERFLISSLATGISVCASQCLDPISGSLANAERDETWIFLVAWEIFLTEECILNWSWPAAPVAKSIAAAEHLEKHSRTGIMLRAAARLTAAAWDEGCGEADLGWGLGAPLEKGLWNKKLWQLPWDISSLRYLKPGA